MSEKRELRISLPYPKMDTPYTFEDMFKEYYKPMHRVLSILLRKDASWAEDLTQESFIRVLEFQKNTGRAIETPTLAGFLSHMVKCSYVKFKRDNGESDLRKYDNDPFILFETEIESDLQEFLDPEKILIQDKRVQAMFGKVEKLKSIDKEILNMLFVEGIPMKVAADKLDISYSNLRKRLQRARVALGSYEEVRSDGMV
jgi:RNA polymerase sigma factor (sigma-70 family)